MIPMTTVGTTTPITMAATLILDAVALTLEAAALKLGGAFTSRFDGKAETPWVADGGSTGTVSVVGALGSREGAKTEGRNHSEDSHAEVGIVGPTLNTLFWSAILTILHRRKWFRSDLF